MQSSLLKDEELLPLEYAGNPARSRQVESQETAENLPPQIHLYAFRYEECEGRGNYSRKPFSFRLEFKVLESARLIGLNLDAGTSERTSKFFFTVFNSSSGNLLGFGDSESILDHATGWCLKVSPEIFLQRGCYVSIQFTFPLISNRSGLPRSNHHFAPQRSYSGIGMPKVILTRGMDCLFPLTRLVFDGPLTQNNFGMRFENCTFYNF
jgi:hypothetical protein